MLGCKGGLSVLIERGPRGSAPLLGVGLRRLFGEIRIANRRDRRMVSRFNRSQIGEVARQRRDVGLACLLLHRFKLSIGDGQFVRDISNAVALEIVLSGSALDIGRHAQRVQRRGQLGLEQALDLLSSGFPCSGDRRSINLDGRNFGDCSVAPQPRK